jgi:hypothetical protein
MVEQKRFKEVLQEHTLLSTRDRLQDLMEPDSYQDLLDAIGNPKVSLGAIQRTLNAMGFEVTKSSIHRWRLSVEIQ